MLDKLDKLNKLNKLNMLDKSDKLNKLSKLNKPYKLNSQVNSSPPLSFELRRETQTILSVYNPTQAVSNVLSSEQ